MKKLKEYKSFGCHFSIYDEGLEIHSFSSDRFIKIENIAELSVSRLTSQITLRISGTNEKIVLSLPANDIKNREHVKLEQFMLGKITEEEFLTPTEGAFLSEKDKEKQAELNKQMEETKMSPIKSTLQLVLVIGVIISIIWSFSSIFSSMSDGGGSSTPAKTVSEEVDKADLGSSAFVISKNYVEQVLKSPSTADFPFMDFTATHLGDGRYLVQSYVDSQNSFGAMIRSVWMVTLKYKSGQTTDPTNWTLEEMVFDGEVVYPQQ